MCDSRCPFTGDICDGGIVHDDETVGCGFKPSADGKCVWLAEVPEATSPRDFHNTVLIDALT